MRAIGVLDKMRTSFINPVQYFLKLGDETIPVNELIGKNVRLQWTGRIICTVCGKKTNKSFGEGMCYNCFSTAPENAKCIIRPKLCRAHLGEGRDVEWEKRNHLRPHYVYLAKTNTVKVGVTRDDQIPTRWIDQGARQGIIVAELPYRQLAGRMEVALKDYFTDKTNWQKMLKNEPADGIELLAEKERIKNLLEDELRAYVSGNNEIVTLTYPVLEYPTKVTSLSFEKTPLIELPLVGIRGQYFIFENGQVINIRSKSGYEVELAA
ncbi:MAG: DUF2797 domain-containing protein [Bacteroidetes bacterium]|nr:DUF2797 domain-containing protein [Bacteroidota bacterium]